MKIKQLPWVDYKEGEYSCAQVFTGIQDLYYEVFKLVHTTRKDGVRDKYCLILGDGMKPFDDMTQWDDVKPGLYEEYRFESIDDAKRAAQKHFELLIKGCLEGYAD